VTIGASAHPARPSRHLGQEKDGRAAANPDLITVTSHTKKDNPAGLPSRPSSPQTTLARRYVLIPKVAGQLAVLGGPLPHPRIHRTREKIRSHQETIHATLDHGLSNGLIESVNTKIRVITRMAFGFHNLAALIGLAMLALGGL
jgi:hypothetical protein